MSDLAAFLRARLDEDEAAALAAVVVASRWKVVNYDHGTEWGVRDGGDGWVADRVDQDTAAHIARHDPARVLRDVEAKRAILDRYERWDEGYGFQSALEIAVSVLAAVYSDHPDYRPEWASE